MLLLACDTQPDAALLDPQTCAECHPAHHSEWEGSMHAHAADDPVFRALNARAVASGEVPEDFCVQCHAPVALALGETQDGLNLDEVPAEHRGVGCAFCHQIEAVTGDNNAALTWSFDGWMRGALEDPLDSSVHRSRYSALLDRDADESSAMCGSCHDVMLPDGLHLERSYLEWQGSIFAEGRSRQGCVHCHLPSRSGLVAEVDGAPERRVHDHSMPAIDVALIDWPGREVQREAIQGQLDNTLAAELCVSPAAGGSQARVSLENLLAGHDFPSGASHDRRVWVELIAYSGDSVVFESGVVPDGVALSALPEAQRIELHDLATTAEGEPAHGISDAAFLEERALPVAPLPLGPHSRTWTLEMPGVDPDRVQMRVLLRPLGLDLLDHHIEAGRLDASLRAEVPTFELASTALTWESGDTCVGALSE